MVRITGPVLVGAVAPADISGVGRTSTATAGASTIASTFAVLGVRNVIVGMCCAPTHTAPAARPHTVAHAATRPQTRQGLGVGVHVGSPNVSSGAQISIIPRKRRSAPIREARLVRGARRNSNKSQQWIDARAVSFPIIPSSQRRDIGDDASTQ